MDTQGTSWKLQADPAGSLVARLVKTQGTVIHVQLEDQKGKTASLISTSVQKWPSCLQESQDETVSELFPPVL